MWVSSNRLSAMCRTTPSKRPGSRTRGQTAPLRLHQPCRKPCMSTSQTCLWEMAIAALFRHASRHHSCECQLAGSSRFCCPKPVVSIAATQQRRLCHVARNMSPHMRKCWLVQVDGPGEVGPSGQISLTEPATGFPMDAARELHSFEIDPKKVHVRLQSTVMARPMLGPLWPVRV